jgi:hypothetical protein
MCFTLRLHMSATPTQGGLTQALAAMEDSVTAMFRKSPLMAFSPLTQLQLQCLEEVAGEIEDLLAESMLDPENANGNLISRSYSRMWLWLLGAYEVLRTMAEAKQCFSIQFHSRLLDEKRHFAEIRMPLAKQEYRGKKDSAWRDGFLIGIKLQTHDAFFAINGIEYSARDLIARFRTFISSIQPADVVKAFDAR